MELKIYLTFEVADLEDPEWQDCDLGETPEEVLSSLISELTYRIGHTPGGRILYLETK